MDHEDGTSQEEVAEQSSSPDLESSSNQTEAQSGTTDSQQPSTVETDEYGNEKDITTSPMADALAAFNKELGRPSSQAKVAGDKSTQKTKESGEEGDTDAGVQTDTAQSQTIPVQGQPQRGRDFTGIAEEDIPVFKHMSNQAFKRAKEIYVENTSLKEQNEKLQKDFNEASGKSFYDHDQAYQVDPEYNSYQVADRRLDSELLHWRQQLTSLRNGGKVQILENYDANGNPVFTEVDPTPEVEAFIFDKMAQGNAFKNQVAIKLGEFQSTYKNRHTEYNNSMQATRNKVFEGMPKEHLTKLANAAEGKLSLFPSYVRNRPEIKMLAEALVLVDGMNALLSEYKGKVSSQNITQRTQRNAGPTGSGNGAANGKGTFQSALDEFHRAGFHH